MSEFRPVKRPRISLSCLGCSARKVRCGREKPECANCKRMKRKCEYKNGTSSQDAIVQQQERPLVNQECSRTNTQVSVSRSVNGGVGAMHLPIPAAPVGHGMEDLSVRLNPVPTLRGISINDSKDFPPHIDFLTLASVLKSIPTKAICDTLLESFHTSVHPIYPLVDTRKFQSYYSDFWKWCNESTPSDTIPAIVIEDITSTCLLLAVLYSGAAAAPPSLWARPVLSTVNRDALLEDRKIACENTLTACAHLDHPTLNTMISSLLSEPFMGRDLDSLSNGLFISTVTRLAQSIGLHREDATEGVDLPAKQTRRRIWGHIWWLDLQYSVVSGIPPVAAWGDEPHAADAVSEILRQATTTPAQCTTLLAQAWSEATRFAHRFIGNMQTMTLITESTYQQFVSEAKALQDTLRTMTAHISSLSRESRNPPVYTLWTRNVLHLIQLEIPILLHAPLLRAGYRPGGPKLEEYWVRLIRLIDRYLQIYLATSPDAACEPYVWSFTRCAGPTHCTYLVLMYLHHWAQSVMVGVARRRVREVFDHWEFLQKKYGLGWTAAQRKLKILYEALATGATGADDINENRLSGAMFDLDIRYLDEVFDYSGRWFEK